jgi:Cytochrome oxidase complex assembly protein 1
VPPEIRRWNWGAFLLNWIWGIVNETYIALLMFVPLVNVVMIFVLGAKGSEWAWRNTRWRDVEHFKRVQRLWAIWGLVAWVAIIVINGGFLALFIWQFPRTEAYLMAVSRLNQSPAATSELGTPIQPGFPWGSISTAGDRGHAELSFSATGPKGHGTVYVDAAKSGGRWQLTRLDLVVADSGRRLDLRGGGGAPKPSPARPDARTPIPEPSGK